jgi:hypothetical protein
MQREVSASAGRHASIGLAFAATLTIPNRNRHQTLRARIGINAASSNMHSSQRSTAKGPFVLVSIADSSLTGDV